MERYFYKIGGNIMDRMLSVTEARSQLPALVKEVVEQDNPVIISTWNQPQVVIVAYEKFVRQQELITLGAKYQLHLLVNKGQSLLEETLEGSVSGDGGLYLFWRSFGKIMREAWELADTFSKPHAMLAFQLLGLSERCLQSDCMLEIEQLQIVAKVLKYLTQSKLTDEDVAEIDRYLLMHKIDARFPLYVEGDLNVLYESEHEPEDGVVYDREYFMNGVENL